MAFFHAEGGDQAIDGFADGDAAGAQTAVVAGGCYGEGLAGGEEEREMGEFLPDAFKG